jgi:glutamate dehydrogenase/leucine dehydrogenase
MEPCKFVADHFCDDVGPAKVVHIYEPKVGLRAIIVIDNIARGPAIGGVRMAADVSTTEVFRLARGMTFKNAAADLRHGGGKSGIIADPNQPEEKREQLIRAFSRAMRNLTEYIPGPDMGTNEQSMAYVYDEIGRCVGLPRALGGIPLDEIGATGYGCVICAEVAAPRVKLNLKGAKFVIEGFGNVGRPAAKFMVERGGILVGASDTKGTIYNRNGIDLAALLAVKAETGSVLNYQKCEKMPVAACLELECDILFPSARPDSINESNVEKVKAKLIIQGANIPCTVEAEKRLHDKGILSIPDFIANAGGVICGALEYHGFGEDQVFPTIKYKIQRNTEELLKRVYDKKVYPRDAAIAIAKERVKGAMQFRLQQI